jgi:hypothetical protein
VVSSPALCGGGWFPTVGAVLPFTLFRAVPAAGDLPCRYSPLQKKSPKRGGGEMRLGLTRGRGREGESSPDSTGRGHFGLADHRSASITETPHSPQLKVPRSGRPPVPSVMRARCIDLPQFGQAGRTVT